MCATAPRPGFRCSFFAPFAAACQLGWGWLLLPHQGSEIVVAGELLSHVWRW